jgi:hypothetical protein
MTSKPFRRWCCLALTAVACLAAGTAPAPADPLGQSAFLRLNDDEVRPRLEVSIMTLKGKDGFTVDLVSAVHIADASYFHDLNNRFTGYDAVLYEMVKPKGAPAPKRGQKSGSAVSAVQRGMKAMLGLTFQLDEIDYQKDNFIHADMDVYDFFAAQEKRGESLFSLMMDAYMRQLTAPPPPPPADGKPVKYRPINFGTTPAERQLALKTIFAGVFGNLERQSLGLDSPEGSAILTDRNDAALKVLREVRKDGKQRIALFYGAAHMPDLAKKLVATDGLEVVNTEWLTAWDLTPPVSPKSSASPTDPGTETTTKPVGQ